jgi:hypothetical protein
MAIQLKNTAQVALDGVKILVYALSGAGKTWLNRTLPNPVIISAESGLLSLQDQELPYIEVATLADLRDAYKWATESEEAKGFESISLDSISEIAEVILNAEKKTSKDGRAAYGATNDTVAELIRAFRDIRGKHVYFSAKCEKVQDEQGRLLYGPSMPGKTLTQGLPYYFDLVLALRVEKDQESGAQYRILQAETDGLWAAKNRGGKLEMWEQADLGEIIKKVQA